jgi:uncharacterized membrane protein
MSTAGEGGLMADKSSTGLEENLAGVLCYLFWWVSGLILAVLETRSNFVRFHALQSIYALGTINLSAFILYWLPIPILGIALFWVVWSIGVVLWIILMVKAYQGEMFKMPWAGNLAQAWVSKHQ